jgi:hypothetical protein
MNYMGLDIKDGKGKTALHLAVESGSASTVKEILKGAHDNFLIILARNRRN